MPILGGATAPPAFRLIREGWLFPSSINPAPDIANRQFDVLKPIWFELNSAGAVIWRDSASFGAVFYYTAPNATLVRACSSEQFAAVSCADPAWMDALCSDSGKRATAVSLLLAACQTLQFTGIELDFEGYGAWTSTQYTNYKTFIAQLGAALHGAGFLLTVDVPPIWSDAATLYTSTNEWTNRNSTAYYQLTYQDFNTLPVDRVCVMAYDYMFDMSAGTPAAPIQWMLDVGKWARSKIIGKPIVMGIPVAGYQGATGGYSITARTYNAMAAAQTISGFTGDPASGEISWANAGVSYRAVDDHGAAMKVGAALAAGIQRVSFWHVGENRYGSASQLS